MCDIEQLSEQENRVAGAFIGTFVGDALGMPVEGWTCERIEQEFGELDRMLDARLGAGTFTDDTQMMVATARSILSCDGVDRNDLASSFLDHYDRRRGYGAGTTQVFQKWQSGTDVEEASKQIFDGGSFGNGGSMRIAPVGILHGNNPVRLEEAIRSACGVTHAHPLGLGGSFLQARSVGLAFQKSESPPPDRWIETLRTDLPEVFDEDGILREKLNRMEQLFDHPEQPVDPTEVVRSLGCTSKAFESVPAAIYAYLANRDSFRQSVVYAVGIGGDTDTIGAMAGAIAGAAHGVRAVSEHWWTELENGLDGRDEIVELSVRFSELVD